METKVSVVIPAYNVSSYITRALASLDNQIRKPDEIIVIDDGSSDDTDKRVAEFSKTSELNIIFERQQNKGCGAARNTGIRRSSGELIVFLDADDIVYPEFLDQATRALNLHHDWVAWFSDRDVVDLDGNLISKDLDHPLFRSLQKRSLSDGFIEISDPELFCRLVGGNVIPMTIVCRRIDVEAISGFDEELRYTEDRMFLLKLCRRGKFGYISKALGTWQRHDMNITGAANALRVFPYTELVFKKILIDEWQPSLSTQEIHQIGVEQRKMSKGWIFIASDRRSSVTFSLAYRLLRERRISFDCFLRAIARYCIRTFQ